MMTALATVSSVDVCASGYSVELSCEQQTSCSSCSSQKSCSTGVVSKAIGNKSLHWNLETERFVKTGQVVEIGFPEKSLLQSAAIVYLIPLFMLMLGALLAQWTLVSYFSLGEGAVILTSALFAWFGVLIAKRFSHRIEEQSSQGVVLIRVLGEPIT